MCLILGMNWRIIPNVLDFILVHLRSQEEVVRIDRMAEEVGTIQSLRNSFQPILNIILVALDAPAIFMRTKALRALGQIVTSDATILSMVYT